MRTIAINQYGDADQFKEVEMEQPKINDNEVLVEIHAFSINPMDIAGRMGMLSAPFDTLWSFPLVLGWDFAGIIKEVGSQIHDFKLGDKVFGATASAHAANNGTYGEFVAVDTKELALIPDGLTFDEAAALPIGGMTAYYGMTHSLNLQSGQKILIQGGSGGVGLMAVQIAKAFGAYVATTASANHTEMLKKVGVDEVIDYHKVAPADILHDYDAVFDTVGDIDGGLKVLKSNGKLITIAGQPTEAQQHDQQKQAAFQFTNGTGQDLSALGKMVVDGKVKQVITTMPFSVESVIKAHKTIEGRHSTGKIVIHVKD